MAGKYKGLSNLRTMLSSDFCFKTNLECINQNCEGFINLHYLITFFWALAAWSQKIGAENKLEFEVFRVGREAGSIC